MGRARVILHIDAQYHDRFTQTKRLAMFGKIHAMITARGGEVVLAPRPKGKLSRTDAQGDGDLHIVDSSNARGVGWLNSAIAYLTGYWHLDGMGILSGAEIAARGALLPPSPPDAAAADRFFAQLCRQFKDKRRTRHEQPETTATLPAGSIAVFLQGRAPERHGQHFFNGPEIIEAAAHGAGGRPVLIKPHPLFWDEGVQMIDQARAEGLDVHLAQAHIHDILAACDVTVSINSAAAIEGFLHGKPTILCGRGDFAAMGETLIDPDDFADALARAIATPRDYAGWLFWYLTQHAIAIDVPDAEARILARFEEAGFDEDRLGLTSAGGPTHVPRPPRSKVIFHIDQPHHASHRTDTHLALFGMLGETISKAGGIVELAERPARILTDAQKREDQHLHIVDAGMAQGRGWLNAAVAYLPGFWHLDPKGVLADSSAGDVPFDPSGVDPDQAAAFLSSLQHRFTLARHSRYDQMAAFTPLPQGCIAVFLQGPAPKSRGHQYIDQEDMLRAVIAAAGTRPVVAKPHPRQLDHGKSILHNLRAEGMDVLETHANVHDILAAAAVTVSINSACAVEGFLHGTPAVLCGKSDFSSQVETARSVGEVAPAVDRAMSTQRNYAPWLFWYFNAFCIDITAKNAPLRLMDRLAKAGFDGARLGLVGHARG